MGVHARPKVRSGLAANKEQRMGDKLAFGIYQPLTEKSQLEVSKAVAAGVKNANRYLEKKRQPMVEFTAPPVYGVTYVAVKNTKAAMKRFGIFQNGFHFGRMVRHIEGTESLQDPEIIIPIGEFDWLGERNQKLVMRIPKDAPLEGAPEQTVISELQERGTSIRRLLAEQKGRGIIVRDPDHVTIASHNGDYINPLHKDAVVELFAESFEVANVGQVALAGITVGPAYDAPRLVLPYAA